MKKLGVLLGIFLMFILSLQLVSADYKITETKPAGDINQNWQTSSMSSNGQIILAGVYGGGLYLSTNGGISWSETQPAGNTDKYWYSSSMSNDGQIILAGVHSGGLYLSTNGGISWSETKPAGNVNKNWVFSSMSNDGQIILAGVNGGRLYLSTNGGTSWSETKPAGNVDKNWVFSSMSNDGQIILAGVNGGRLYLSTNGGISWSETQPAGNVDKNWYSSSMSDDGQTIIAGVYGGRLYLLINGGISWSETQPAGNVDKNWYSSSMSDDGQTIIAGVCGGRLYLLINKEFTISTNVNNFNAIINNNQYNTTTGIIETEYIPGEDLLNISISSLGYENITYLNYNTTNNIDINLTPYYYLNNITYNNIINYSNTLYSRNISSIFEIYCNSTTNTNIELIVNNQSIKNQSINCINQLNNYTINYQPINESIYYIDYNITSLAIDNYQWNDTINTTLIIDLFNPIIEYNYTLNNTFGNIINISTLCYDNITPLLVYNITFNNNNIYYGNQSNNTLINNQTTLIDGNNNFIVKCSDFFGTTTTNESIDATVKTIQLIDERTGVNFNVNSTEKVFVYFSDTSYFSFTSPFVNISSINNTNLRFELEYLDAIITRYIDMSLIDDQDIRVCVSREGTTFYNQDIISATTKPALLKSSFADCYVLAYPLSFAYQDAYSVKAYTTPTLYYLYTKDQGKDVLLASFDGAQDSYVNLDTLEFSKTSYQVSLLADALSIDIDRNNNNTLIIYYQNIENENTNIRMVITDENGVVLVDTDELNPNEFTTYFNFNSYEIKDKTLFKVTLTKTKEDGTISEQSKFFDPMGKSGTIQPTFAAILAVLFLFFSLTIVIPRLSLSWLGLLFEIITLLILSFAVPVWYINFLVAINVIILVYTFFMMSQINYPTVVS